MTVRADVSGPAPESKAFSANCGRSLSFSIDRWRGLCGAVIQVETKLELSCVRHEAGLPWRIEHDFNMYFLDTGHPPHFLLYVALAHHPHPAPATHHAHLEPNSVPTQPL